MASAKQDLYDAIKHLASDNVAPQGGEAPARPYVTYFEVVGVPEHTLDTERAGLTCHLFQIDIFSESYLDADVLHGDLQTAMAAAPFKCVERSHRDIYEPETKLHRVLTEWSIWAA